MLPAQPTSAADAYDESYYAARYRYSPTSMYWWSVRYYARILLRALAPDGADRRKRVLELGAGTGHVMLQLASRCATFGVDISAAAVQRAREVAPTATLVRARGEALPFATATFDGAIARHVLEHVPDPRQAVAELRRVLRPGAVLLAIMPNPRSIGRAIKRDRWYGFSDPTHVSLLDPGEWRGIFTAGGFTVGREWGDGLWDVPYVPLLPAALQLPLFGLPAAVQVVSGGRWIPTRAGESCIFLLHASGRS